VFSLLKAIAWDEDVSEEKEVMFERGKFYFFPGNIQKTRIWFW